MIQLSDALVFLEIASSRSFTETARKLSLPKSSVARQLQRLEDELGARLVARTTRSVALTEDGQAFLPHARRLVDDSIEAENALRRDGTASGLLGVTAPSTLTRYLIAPHLGMFHARYPNIRLIMNLSARKLDLGQGEVDVAVRIGSLIDGGVGRRHLGRIEYALVATSDYLRGRPRIRAPRDLLAQRVIELRPPAREYALEMSRNGQTECLRYVPALEVNDPDTVKVACLAHVGIAPLPKFLVAEELRAGRLVHLLPDWQLPPVDVNALYETRHAPTARVRVYLDFLTETMGRDGGLLR